MAHHAPLDLNFKSIYQVIQLTPYGFVPTVDFLKKFEDCNIIHFINALLNNDIKRMINRGAKVEVDFDAIDNMTKSVDYGTVQAAVRVTKP